MVDELLLHRVEGIFKKIDLIRSKEDFEQLKIDNGLIDLSEDEVNEFLVEKFMSVEDIDLYKKYMIYKRNEDLNSLAKIIDSVSNLTSKITILYDENKKYQNLLCSINKIIECIDLGLRDYPNIRVATAYSKVKVDYNKYFGAFVTSGVERAGFTEEINRINRSSVIVRSLKKRRLKQLSDGLVEHNINSKLCIDTMYDDYLNSRDEYEKFLIDVMVNLLSKNDLLFEAGILSLVSLYHDNIKIITLSDGAKVVDKEEKDLVTPKYIAQRAFEYFQKMNEPNFDEKVFISSFRKFLLHFYTNEIDMINVKISEITNEIRYLFKMQVELVDDMNKYKKNMEIPYMSFDQDSKDTMALIYRNSNINQ